MPSWLENLKKWRKNMILNAIRQLMALPENHSKKIGFQLREKGAFYGKG